MNATMWKAIAAISTSISLVCIGAIFSMWNNQRDLMNWHMHQWPLEKQLLLVDHEQTEARLMIIDAEMQRIRDDIQDSYRTGNQ